MKYIIIIFCILSTFSLSAQDFDEDQRKDQLVPGYVITNDMDTIRGKIKVQSRSRNQVKVKFTSVDGTKHSYKPKEIFGYAYQTVENNNNPTQIIYRWRHFHTKKADMAPVPFGSKTVFMEVKAHGKAILYSFYVQRNGEVDNNYMHFYYLTFQDGSRERMITQDDFEWAVPAFLEDCPKIPTVVNSSMGYSKLEEIVDIYNDCDKYKITKPDCDCDDVDKAKKEKEHSNKDK